MGQSFGTASVEVGVTRPLGSESSRKRSILGLAQTEVQPGDDQPFDGSQGSFGIGSDETVWFIEQFGQAHDMGSDGG